MNNCYVNVCGGIGNQLFQVANGYSYSRKHNKDLYIDTSSWTASQGQSPEVYKDTIFKNFKYGSSVYRNVIPITEKEFNYGPLPFLEGSVSLTGYYQSLKYFDDYLDVLKGKIFLPEVKTCAKVLVSCKS